jgi:hypothetical protein
MSSIAPDVLVCLLRPLLSKSIQIYMKLIQTVEPDGNPFKQPGLKKRASQPISLLLTGAFYAVSTCVICRTRG